MNTHFLMRSHTDMSFVTLSSLLIYTLSVAIYKSCACVKTRYKYINNVWENCNKWHEALRRHNKVHVPV